MELEDILELEITKMDHFARGIANYNGLIVFVNNTLTGDRVKVKIIKKSKKYLEADVIEYLHKSELRMCKVCKYSLICNCGLIDTNYEYQLNYKKHKVKEIFSKICKQEVFINDIIYCDNKEYRNKAVFHYSNNIKGFYKENTNNLINIDSCPLLDKKINDIYSLINMNTNNECLVRVNKENIMLSFRDNISDELLNNLSQNKKVTSIYINNKLVYGKEFLTIKLLDKYSFEISPLSFFQVNTKVFSKTLEKILLYLDKEKSSTVLDLYCGVGVIGIAISNKVKKIIGIEEIKEAIDNANRNKKINKINNIEFICGKVEDKIDQLEKNIDIVIVDPPRKGLDTKTIKNILKLSPKKIVYLSCNVNTLARDINLLNNNYLVDEVTLIDMFPNTYHVECLCLLKCY